MPIDLNELEPWVQRYQAHEGPQEVTDLQAHEIAKRAPAMLEQMRELRVSNIRLLQVLKLLTPADGWAGYEDAEGREIGTLVQAAIDAARKEQA